ncbi:hypothetical protein TREES_T100010527 [Tupaia chinensis]|uniref:Uncharacterized protein n=1 Tax=Tupaia chinensis TaxID=246437 RepID=L9LAP4_TUPCH|nr:hypothetical protein TREES_T100010527 [Tupaia chinensis]
MAPWTMFCKHAGCSVLCSVSSFIYETGPVTLSLSQQQIWKEQRTNGGESSYEKQEHGSVLESNGFSSPSRALADIWVCMRPPHDMAEKYQVSLGCALPSAANPIPPSVIGLCPPFCSCSPRLLQQQRHLVDSESAPGLFSVVTWFHSPQSEADQTWRQEAPALYDAALQRLCRGQEVRKGMAFKLLKASHFQSFFVLENEV